MGGTDRNGFRIGGGLLSFALSGFFVFFFGLAVLGLTVRVSVLGITVLGIAVGTSVGFLLGLFDGFGGLLGLGSLDDLGGLGGGRCGFLSIGHFNSSKCLGSPC